MSDVLKIALDRRAELQEEAARLDQFIRMADSLMRQLQPGSAPAEPDELHAEDETPAAFREPQAAPSREVGPGVTRMNLMRRGPTAAAG